MPFETKIRKARFVVAGYSAEQMVQMGNGLIEEAIRPRIRSGHTVQDAPAPALSAKYAKRKIRAGKQPIRDWTLTGRTLRSMKVLTAGPNRAVIGLTDAETNRRAFFNNRRSQQFGVSPNDRGKLPRIVARLDSPIKAQVA